MKPLNLLAALALACGVAAAAQPQQASVGEAAPAFTAADVDGRTVSLADFKGKTVVLEWVNPACPYVQKHYGAGNMQSTQRASAGKGVIWLAVNSTAKDHRDYMEPAAMARWMKAQKAAATAMLMDPEGLVGRAYQARTTPHMYVIDARGMLVYAGAIDSKPSANPADIASARNHVNAALAETLAGRLVSTPLTRAYGCSVKYSSAS